MTHRPANFSIGEEKSKTFDNGQKLLSISLTRDAVQYSILSELNREDLFVLRSVIDEYLSKTVPQPNYD